jgi:hypothetical protein
MHHHHHHHHHQPPTTFLHLPAELRNQIYAHALIEPNPIMLPYAYEKRPFDEPALLSTCHTIQREATPLYYGANTFEAPSPSSAHHFLRQLGPAKIAHLRRFRPVTLVFPVSAHPRWFDALCGNVNRLVRECGEGVLRADAVSVAVRGRDGLGEWCRVRELQGFEVVGEGEEEDGCWQLVRRPSAGA